MKKWLAFILLLVTMAGTFFPCCTEDNCSAELEASAQEEKRTDKEEGTCSPFFSCRTCTGFAQLIKPLIVIPAPLIQKSIHFERVISFTIASFSSSFWQPPRPVYFFSGTYLIH